MLKFFGGFILSFLSSTACHALDLSQQQKNAVNHIAQVVATESYCPEYRANAVAINAMAKGYRLDLNDQYIRNVTTLLAKEHLSGLRAAGQKAGCLAAWALYGPGGENVPNLLARR